MIMFRKIEDRNFYRRNCGRFLMNENTQLKYSRVYGLLRKSIVVIQNTNQYQIQVHDGNGSVFC